MTGHVTGYATASHAPLDMVVNVGNQRAVTAVLAVVVAILAIWALRTWITERDPLMFVLLAGGGLGVLNEPIVDLLGNVWFARPNQQVAVEWFGMAVPVWGVLAYVAYFGWMPYLLYRWARRGLTRAQFRKLVLVAFLVNLAIEIPILQTGLYVYFGYSPMQFAGLPTYWLLINAGGPVLCAVLLVHVRGVFSGPGLALLAVLPMTTDAAMSLAIGWPAFVGLHQGDGNPPHAVAWVGCIGTIVLGTIILDQLGRALALPTAEARSASTRERNVAMIAKGVG